MSQEQKTFVVVEDSAFYAERHKKHLQDDGAEVVVLRTMGEFNKFIEKKEASKKIFAVIADGLHGDWMGVVEEAKKNNIQHVYIITGNKDIIEQSKYFPGVVAINKADLTENPQKYQDLIK